MTELFPYAGAATPSTCAWCSEPHAGQVVIEDRRSRLPKMAPACANHLRHFNAQAAKRERAAELKREAAKLRRSERFTEADAAIKEARRLLDAITHEGAA